MAVSKKDPAREVTSISGIPLKPVYGPDDLGGRGWTYEERLGNPGQYPYTRGVHDTMYRGKPWAMRMFAGLGPPPDTPRPVNDLLRHRQTRLSAAFPHPTPIC